MFFLLTSKSVFCSEIIGILGRYVWFGFHWNHLSTKEWLTIILKTSVKTSVCYFFFLLTRKRVKSSSNPDFQTFVNFPKIKKRLEFLTLFSKITHQKICLVKIWADLKIWGCPEILTPYRHFLLRTNTFV